MADEDSDIDLGEGSETVSTSSKGGKGNFLPTILKYVGLGLGAIILIVTVVLITMNIAGGSSSKEIKRDYDNEDFKEYVEELDWYQSLGDIQTRTSDASQASVQVTVFLGYEKDSKAASQEITAQKIRIRDFLRHYFADKTVEELSPKNEDRLKIEIRNEINDTILNKSKIRAVVFDKLNVVVQ